MRTPSQISTSIRSSAINQSKSKTKPTTNKTKNHPKSKNHKQIILNTNTTINLCKTPTKFSFKTTISPQNFHSIPFQSHIVFHFSLDTAFWRAATTNCSSSFCANFCSAKKYYNTQIFFKNKATETLSFQTITGNQQNRFGKTPLKNSSSKQVALQINFTQFMLRRELLTCLCISDKSIARQDRRWQHDKFNGNAAKCIPILIENTL